jgi:hypothetical protein
MGREEGTWSKRGGEIFRGREKGEGLLRIVW